MTGFNRRTHRVHSFHCVACSRLRRIRRRRQHIYSKPLANSGKAWALVSGAGEVFGAWVIESLTETRTVLMDNGAPRRIEFELQLAAVDDERAEPSGGVDPWPTDDGWEWWL